MKSLVPKEESGKLRLRLAITSLLLLIPAGIFASLYVGVVNRKVEQANDSLVAIDWVSRINQFRIDVLSDDREILHRFDDIELALDRIADELIATGVVSIEERDAFKNSANYKEKGPGYLELRWRRKILKDLDFGSDAVREILGYSLSTVLEHDEGSHLLFSLIPDFALESYKVNSWIRDTLNQNNSEQALSSMQVRTVALVRLRVMNDEIDRVLKNLSSKLENGRALKAMRLRNNDLFEAYEAEARRLIENKRNLALLDVMEQVNSSVIANAEKENLWKLGKSVSLGALETSTLLEAGMRASVTIQRDFALTKRNHVLGLVSCFAFLALLLIYYVAKNISVVHVNLSEQNKTLESTIRERVAEIEQARAGAIEAAAIAERERNNVIELNDVLREQTEISNTLARKAVAAEKAKSQFLANISHEIRTPMNGVIGMTHMLRDSGLNETQLGHIETLEHCSESLLALIDDVLDLSKIEAGKLEIEETECDINHIISKTVALYAPTAHEKNLELLSFYPISFNKNLVFDSHRLRQVISNLVSNAIKFTHQGFVRFDADILEEDEDNVVFKFSVRDTGIGISEKGLQRLFSPFAQEDGSTTRKFGGTGLGLAISKKLVGMMGGDIEVRSEVDVGSEFSFSLSLKKGTLNGAPQVESSKGKERCLVVSDSEAVAEYLKKSIEYLGTGCDVAFGWDEKKDTKGYRRLFVSEDIWNSVESGSKLASSRSQVVVLGKDWNGELPSRAGALANLEWLPKPYELFKLNELIIERPALEPGKKTAKAKVAEQFDDFKVLLVDDNEINLLVAGGLLGKFGVVPHKAKSGEEALELCMKNEYDLVFMDCMMPGMDGYETTEAIRSGHDDCFNRETPIVALTANAMKGDREKCLASGMSDYLSKPLRNDELSSVLKRWLSDEPDEAVPAESLVEDEHKLLDLAECRKVFEVQDESALASLLAVFVESLNEQLGSLEKAISGESDLAKIQLISSDLKGSTANHGAEKLNRIAARMEKACRDRNSSEAAELFAEMKRLSVLTQHTVSEFTA